MGRLRAAFASLAGKAEHRAGIQALVKRIGRFARWRMPAASVAEALAAAATSAPVSVGVGDITDCRQIPDESYDFFEPVDRPRLRFGEITGILRSGGVAMRSIPFYWRYHPCPGDYFRYTPEGLANLFPDMHCIRKSFDYAERRRGNVRVNHAGVKRKMEGVPI